MTEEGWQCDLCKRVIFGRGVDLTLREVGMLGSLDWGICVGCYRSLMVRLNANVPTEPGEKVVTLDDDDD